MSNSQDTISLDNVPMQGYVAEINVDSSGAIVATIFYQYRVNGGFLGDQSGPFLVSTGSYMYNINGRFPSTNNIGYAGIPLYYSNDGIYFSGEVTNPPGTSMGFYNQHIFFTTGYYNYGQKVVLSESSSAYHGPTQGDPICYLAGSKVETLHGLKNIEDIEIGEKILTYNKEGKVLREEKIIWCGYNTVFVKKNFPDDRAGYPVRILKDAISKNIPFKDFLVTPEHGIFLKGKFVPARMLVNGASMFFDKSIEKYSYYHIETERHAIIKVDGVFSETYLDTGNRKSFYSKGNITPFLLKNKTWQDDGAAPIGNERDFVEPIFHQLAVRAREMKLSKRENEIKTNNYPNIHLKLEDGTVIFPKYEINGYYSFVIPPKISTVYIVSKVSRPSDVIGPFVNQRNYLGIAIGDIYFFEGKKTNKLTQHVMSQHLAGWYNLEWNDTRWTRGKARLDLGARDTTTLGLLCLQVKAAGPYVDELDEILNHKTA